MNNNAPQCDPYDQNLEKIQMRRRAPASRSRAEVSVEVALLRDDYIKDREFILNGINAHLKAEEFDAASELVERYRNVASSDRAFQIVADRVDDFIYRREALKEARLEFELTSETDLINRLKRIEAWYALEQTPETQSLLASTRKAAEKAGLINAPQTAVVTSSQPKKIIISTQDQIPNKATKLQKVIFGIVLSFEILFVLTYSFLMPEVSVGLAILLLSHIVLFKTTKSIKMVKASIAWFFGMLFLMGNLVAILGG